MKKTRSTSPSLRSSKNCLRACLGIAVWLAFGQAFAQEAPTIQVPSPVLVIDQDRLFSETRPGNEALRGLEADAQELAQENQRIESQLIEREQELTELRLTTPPEEFRTLADQFDARVERIRSEQDEKERALNLARDEIRQVFFQEVAGVISEILLEKGAVVVVDRRTVFMSSGAIDITDEAIERINRVME